MTSVQETFFTGGLTDSKSLFLMIKLYEFKSLEVHLFIKEQFTVNSIGDRIFLFYTSDLVCRTEEVGSNMTNFPLTAGQLFTVAK